MGQTNWDTKHLQLAQLASTWSKDPSTQTGAVIVDKNGVFVSLGFNGFPKGIADDDRLQDRSLKYEIIIHCEINAIIFAKQSLEGCTLYTYPFGCCSRCASIVIQTGIKRVVFPLLPDSTRTRWWENLELAKNMFSEAGVMYKEIK